MEKAFVIFITLFLNYNHCSSQKKYDIIAHKYNLRIYTETTKIKKTEIIRKSYLEVFYISPIAKYHSCKNYNLIEQYKNYINKITKLSLRTDLVCSSGAMYLFIMENKISQAILKKEYQIQKGYLSFVIS